MRRSLISMSTINRLISSSNRAQREKSNSEILNSQGGNIKEKTPVYVLNKVDFNINTRITRLEFIQKQEYRTIQRYITQDYVKYPVYSGWKTRTKTINKTIKLTNIELESLNCNSDFLIKQFAEDIIIALNNEELLPSWFLQLYLKKELEEKIKILNTEFTTFQKDKQNKINLENAIIIEKIKELKPYVKKLNKKTKKINKAKSLLEHLDTKQKSVFKSIASLGIYSYLISQTRKNKIHKRIQKLNNEICATASAIDKRNTIIKDSEDKIKKYKDLIKQKQHKIKEKKDIENSNYIKKVSEITPLSRTVQTNNQFIALKLFSGLEYEKIIGCYVIHNKEKDKYYVGQSKDIMKRIKQHFKGTIPNNQIFAEDYYTSLYPNKEDLFEIKIIKCKTKDELDKTEKELIYEYDSRNNGYNGTNGNT